MLPVIYAFSIQSIIKEKVQSIMGNCAKNPLPTPLYFLLLAPLLFIYSPLLSFPLASSLYSYLVSVPASLPPRPPLTDKSAIGVLGPTPGFWTKRTKTAHIRPEPEHESPTFTTAPRNSPRLVSPDWYGHGKWGHSGGIGGAWGGI